ncbi:RNA polymerase sigma factor [Pedobacter metabolipauper]|uniref:RNA polymerase sigma-70 factor (ECF subfamily) n=1 Tax=Pedobacter metabolipauper TaxID=425513 RepID=A0A4R6SZ34_9SPHI|nr:sigma-70 family RNA polymerase sigma factor [Pedobacter metabolipauper]TDQ11285.1 RNA polymerase sigma-70 factor (ECF subfamily) [Pedobacter metabolipauper]
MLINGRNDEELVQHLKDGDAAAYDLLYEKYWKKLYIQAVNRIKDEEAAKDIIQSVFINLWERRENINISSSLEQFLSGAVKLQVLNFFRTEKAEGKLMDHTLQKLEAASVSIHELSDYLDLEHLIDAEVKKLPENMRHAYLLRHELLSTSEIAQKLNLAEQTVSNHISEAMRRIRMRVKDKFPERSIS